MVSDLKFGAIYFHHMSEPEYVGPRLIKEIGGDYIQLDTADVGFWYKTQKKEDNYDWSLLDKAFLECKVEGIEPIPTLSHHFIPPNWIEKGPFNRYFINNDKYECYGEEFKDLTIVQKSFADFVSELVKRYRTRTNVYIYSHEWNMTQFMLTKPNTVEYNILLENQLICTILGYKIIKNMHPSAKVTFGLVNFYRRDAENGKQLTPLTSGMEEMPFGPSDMIKKYVKTGDEDYLKLLETTYMFYIYYATGKVFGPFYFDDTVGDALTELYNGSITLDGKRYFYRDYIKDIFATAFSISGRWGGNPEKFYTEDEQAQILETSLKKIIEAKDSGVPIKRVILPLNDKNEDWEQFKEDRWLYVPEGIYKMKGSYDPFKSKAIGEPIQYEPKKAVEIYRKFAGT